MAFVRDLFAPATQAHVPLTLVTNPQQQTYHPDGSAEAGPSNPYPDGPQNPLQTLSVPSSPVPPYSDEDDDFNSRAVPRRSADRSRLYAPGACEPTTLSVCSTATNTPNPSRSPSPLPFYHYGASSCSSDSESEIDGPLISRRRPQRTSWRGGERPRWWHIRLGSGGSASGRDETWRRRRMRDVTWGVRSGKRIVRGLVRHPFFPKTPVTILLTLLLLTIFGVSLKYLLTYILNPDKEPLPWRGYCTLPAHDAGPPSLHLTPSAFLQTPIPTDPTLPAFPPPDFDSLAPVGVFVGVFSMDTSVERRMLVRSTWANHVRSREGAGEGDGGVGTSRTVVRFILGQPRNEDWERRVKLEMETYKDMVILPIHENMNGGKTHAYFSWAANESWVPPLYSEDFGTTPGNLSYANATHPAPALAVHDPVLAHRDQLANSPPKPWVKPDFVVKADDDSFVMLAELEARLRVELHKGPLPPPPTKQLAQQSQLLARDDGDSDAAVINLSPIADYLNLSLSYLTRTPPTLLAAPPAVTSDTPSDPLVFWGYLVKNRFMAGELYALSFALVEWVATDPVVKTMTRGAEDKQTSKWIRSHPRASQVRWSSERCWIYDHPRAGTVYSHGFLFPSEVKRVQEGVVLDLQQLAAQVAKTDASTSTFYASTGQFIPSPERWTRSTVSKFGVRYTLPVPDLSLEHSIEALVEGSGMSMLHDDGSMSPDLAWKYREGRRKRYEDKRVGGTVVVHFIKMNMWFLETAAAFLEGDDVTALERAWMPKLEAPPAEEPASSSVDPVPEETATESTALSTNTDTDSTSTATATPILTLTHAETMTTIRRSRRDMAR